MKYILSLFALALVWHAQSQSYEFTDKIDLESTPVISQGRTGTCWSFSTSSFLESEILRIKGLNIDLSEMYNVRYTYPVKARNYLMRQGKAQFSEGGLAHDVINSARLNGLMPNEVYSGMQEGAQRHDHSELVAELKKIIDIYNTRPNGTLDQGWKDDVDSTLNHFLGEAPELFTYEGKTYTPHAFMEMAGIQPNDYITVTSFSHVPYYNPFVLNIPDNFSNGSMYNVPLDEMMKVVDHALENGFTIELDCDVSEKTFSAGSGVAVVPADENDNDKCLQQPVDEKMVDQEYRQLLFEDQRTTDDHLMHITGVAVDQNGKRYYKVKNSWGTGSRVAYGGFVYMSEAYFRLKTISIMIHKDALPADVAKALDI